MDLDDSLQLDKLVSEIATLKSKARLLDIVLGHYDDIKMEFKPMKDSWSKRIHISKFPSPTPREHLAKQIRQHLSNEDLSKVGLYNL